MISLPGLTREFLERGGYVLEVHVRSEWVDLFSAHARGVFDEETVRTGIEVLLLKEE